MRKFSCLTFWPSLLNLLLSLAALSGGLAWAESTATHIPPLTNVTLQLRWTPQFQFAGYYVARMKGFYAAEGLNVQIIPGNGNRTQIVEEVLTRRADFGVGNSGLAIVSLQGQPVTVIANIFQRSAAVMITRPGLEKSLGLLSQKNLSFRNLQDNPEIYAIFNQAGISPSSLANVTTATSGYDEFINGQTDAFNAYIGNENYLLEKNKTPFVMIDPYEYGLAFYGDALFTHSDFAKNNPELVNKFARATIKGWIYALDNVNETIEFLHAGPASHKSIEHLKFEADAIKNLVMPDYVSVGQINPKRWESIAQTFKSLGIVNGQAKLNPGFFMDYWQQRRDNTITLTVGAGILAFIILILFGNLWFLRINRQLRAALKEKDDLLLIVENMANHDQLTGLPNRRLLFDRIDRAIIHAKRNKHQVGVCVIDLNGFKFINDECGHPAGDQALIAVANRLKDWLRESDSAGRLGGDEFFFMTEVAHSRDGMDALIHRLGEAFVQPFIVRGKPYVLSFSYGIALYPEDGSDTASLISRADERMYANKNLSRHTPPRHLSAIS